MLKITGAKNLAVVLTVLAVIALSGCKAQQQLQTQVAELTGKVDENQKKIASLDGELKKATFEVNQLKGLVTKLGNVIVDLQKSEEEERARAAEAKARASAKPKAKPGAKKAAPAAKKKH